MRRIIMEVPDTCEECIFKSVGWFKTWFCFLYGKEKKDLKPLKYCRDAEIADEVGYYAKPRKEKK